MNTRKRSLTVLAWLISMVNPPPRASMTKMQKVSRVFLFTTALVMLCILFSMGAAMAIFALQRGHEMLKGYPMLLDDIGIIFASMIVNTLCVLVLLRVKSADQNLFPPPETSEPAEQVERK